jgi:hypothetical protein
VKAFDVEWASLGAAAVTAFDARNLVESNVAESDVAEKCCREKCSG